MRWLENMHFSTQWLKLILIENYMDPCFGKDVGFDYICRLFVPILMKKSTLIFFKNLTQLNIPQKMPVFFLLKSRNFVKKQFHRIGVHMKSIFM